MSSIHLTETYDALYSVFVQFKHFLNAFNKYPPDSIRVEFERLATVPGLFTDEAERVAAALSALEAHLPLLRAGWEGPAADIFFADMETDIRPGLRRLVHALRYGSDVSAVMLRALDEAERAAARIDWSGRGVVATAPAASAGMTDLPSISPPTDTTTSLAPSLATDPLSGRTTFWQYPLALDEERWPSPHTAANDGSGVVRLVVDGTGVLTLEPGFGGGGSRIGALALLGILIYHATLWEAERQRLAQNTTDVTLAMGLLLLASNKQATDAARSAGVDVNNTDCAGAWSDYLHDYKEMTGRRAAGRAGDLTWKQLVRLAKQFLEHFPRCRR